MKQVVTITRMGYSSEAIGRLESGKTVFVQGGVPGDVATIEIVQEKKAFARARILGLNEASPVRTQPLCAQTEVCGGCPWAHLSYEAQIQAKYENVVAALVHTAHFNEDDARKVVGKCCPSKRQWGYRNKLELGAQFDENGVFTLGLYRGATHDIASVQTCPLVHPSIEKSPKVLRGALRFAQGSQDLGIFRVGVRSSVRTCETEVALWTKPGLFPRAHVAKTLASALETSSIVRVLATPDKARKIKGVEVIGGRGFWTEEVAGARFLTSAPSFFQVNTASAEKLVSCVLDALGGKAGLSGVLVADLYAGGGTFSIPLARAKAQVIAVESAGSSVRDLQRNADVNGVDITVIGGDASRELPKLGALDALVLDPPRAGLAKRLVADIVSIRPKKVAYVSCNPITWARDVALFEEGGYRLSLVQPYDMFPQTSHVELVSIFEDVRA